MVAAQVVLSLSVLMAMLAVVADGGLLLVERRHAQATADAAALAAASDLFFYWYTNSGLDPGGTASASAMGVASYNGYTNDGTTSKVTVNISPADYSGGPNAGKALPAGYAEVTVTWYQKRGFSGFLGSGAIPVSARAVARGVVQPQPQPTQPPQPPVAVLLISASSALPAPTVTGGGLVVVDSGAPQLPDFLSYLPAPSIGNPPPGISVQNLPTITSSTVLASNTIYIAPAGGLTLSSSDSITGTNGVPAQVMIYVPSGSINLNQGTVKLSPMTTGPYAGVTIFQDRSDPNGGAMIGNANNGNLNISGTIYAPAASLSLEDTGTGTGTTDTFGSQIIAQSLTTEGTVTVAFDPATAGRLRFFGLVE